MHINVIKSIKWVGKNKRGKVKNSTD